MVGGKKRILGNVFAAFKPDFFFADLGNVGGDFRAEFFFQPFLATAPAATRAAVSRAELLPPPR